ncbi:MAG: alcohol dehydrogenase family protein [Rhodobacteraceae bacterium]|nr:alcohol dehydrogenase family protein [Paracoccaceae bacterium]
MRAMVLTGQGGMEVYEFHTDWPVPKPGAEDVLIRVAACGLNNTDVNTRSGWYSKAVTGETTGGAYETIDNDGTWGGAPLSFPRIQGADVCGHIVAVGTNVDTGRIGQRVITDNWLRDWDDPMNRDKTAYFGSESDGGFAEYTKIDYRNAITVNSAYSDAALATFSCSWSTAEGMLDRAGVGPGDRVLITGASGGVGSALIGLANRRGAMTIALASKAKHAEVAPLNPTHLLPRAPDDLPEALKAATGFDKVTVVADIVGGPYWETLINVLARGGRYTCSGAIAGPIVEMDLRTFYLNDLTFTGSTVIAPHVTENLVKYIGAGEVKPVLAATYPLEQLPEAQQAFIDKKHTGNIVVTM